MRRGSEDPGELPRLPEDRGGASPGLLRRGEGASVRSCYPGGPQGGVWVPEAGGGLLPGVLQLRPQSPRQVRRQHSLPYQPQHRLFQDPLSLQLWRYMMEEIYALIYREKNIIKYKK